MEYESDKVLVCQPGCLDIDCPYNKAKNLNKYEFYVTKRHFWCPTISSRASIEEYHKITMENKIETHSIKLKNFSHNIESYITDEGFKAVIIKDTGLQFFQEDWEAIKSAIDYLFKE